MPVTREKAESVLQVLCESSTTKFAACQGNGHLFDAHYDKASASAAVTGGAPAKGYFKKAVDKDVLKPVRVGKKGKKRTEMVPTGETRPGTQPLEFGSTAIFNIVGAALAGDDYELYSGGAAENDRFVYVAPLPKGYAGRSMVAGPGGPQKQKTGITHIAIVIGGCNGGNVYVATAFPVDAAYIAGKTKLV